MTDAERLALIRRRLDDTSGEIWQDQRLLSRHLDEARAEIEDWRGRLATQCGKTLAAQQERDQALAEISRLRGHIGDLNRENLMLTEEIARLREANARLQQSLGDAQNEAARRKRYPGRGGWR